jgi:histone-lysine N-methyltransferase ASH1L
MEFDQNMIIDATRGSIARFVNHACEPNCKMVKWNVAGKPRMALFAGERPIMTGEELSYDYNFEYAHPRASLQIHANNCPSPFSSKNIQECRCGSAACRGVLGPRVSKDKEPKDALASLTKPASANGHRRRESRDQSRAQGCRQGRHKGRP